MNGLDEPDVRIGAEFQRRTSYAARAAVKRALEHSAPQRPRAHAERVSLPSPRTGDGTGIWDAMRTRRSLREYASSPLPLSTLSQLLWAAQGVTARHGPYALRTAPSAGALYPVETYLAVNSVEEVPPGIYRYLVGEHALLLEREGNPGAALSAAALDQTMCDTAAACFIWSAVIARSARKYAQRAYRYIYLDAGHIAQNVALAASALGLGACAVGAFYDDAVNSLIGADGDSEFALYMMCVGTLR